MTVIQPLTRARSVGIRKALRQRNRRVEAHRDIVRPLALHYAHRSPEPSEDLMQVGLMGLIRAAELYDRDRHTPFEAFARPHIRGAILHYLRDFAPLVRLPRRKAELQARLSRLQAAWSSVDGTDGEFSRRLAGLGVSEEQWHLLRQHRQLNHPCSLDGAGMEDHLADPSVCDVSGQGEDGDAGESGGRGGAEVLDQLRALPVKERIVVESVVLQGSSHRAVGRTLGVSPMTVKRLLKKGLDGLRRRLDEGGGVAEGPGTSASNGSGWNRG